MAEPSASKRCSSFPFVRWRRRLSPTRWSLAVMGLLAAALGALTFAPPWVYPAWFYRVKHYTSVGSQPDWVATGPQSLNDSR